MVVVILDNVTNTSNDDLKESIHKGCRIRIAAVCFEFMSIKNLKSNSNVLNISNLFASCTK